MNAVQARRRQSMLQGRPFPVSADKARILGSSLVQPHRLAHGGLDVEALHVLPVLLQQRDQKVDRHLDVDIQLLIIHGHVTDGHAHAQHLLQLELYARLELVHLQGGQ